MFGWLKTAHNQSWNKAKCETEAVFAIQRVAGIDVRELETSVFERVLNETWDAVSKVPESTKEDFVFFSFGQFAYHYPLAIGDHLRMSGIRYARSVHLKLSPTVSDIFLALDGM